MPVSSSHDLSNATDVVGWNVFMKEVAHRVDEDLARASPVERLLKLFGHQPQVEALLEGVSRHAAKTLREHLRVAEFAARAHLRAAADGVPRRVRPLNRRAVAHRLSLQSEVDSQGHATAIVGQVVSKVQHGE